MHKMADKHYPLANGNSQDGHTQQQSKVQESTFHLDYLKKKNTKKKDPNSKNNIQVFSFFIYFFFFFFLFCHKMSCEKKPNGTFRKRAQMTQ